MGDYNISDIYQGGYSSLDPEKSYGNVFTGYRIPVSSIGMATDPRTANIVKEASEQISSGTKTVEISQVDHAVFESIPTDQLEELRRVSNLVGVDMTLHAPIIEPSGVDKQGRWSEVNMQKALKQIEFALDRANKINPEKSSPVTFHSSAVLPGTHWEEVPWKEKGVEGKMKSMIAIDQETGQAIPLEEEKLFYPTGWKPKKDLTQEQIKKYEKGELKKSDIMELVPLAEDGRTQIPERRLESLNATKWSDSVSQQIFNKERADEILQTNQIQIQHLLEGLNSGKYKKQEDLSPTQLNAYNHYINAKAYIEEVDQHVKSLFHKAFKYGSKEEREYLKELSSNFGKQIEKSNDPLNQSQALQMLLEGLTKVHPEVYVPVEKFALDKSSEVFAKAATRSYKEYKGNAPIISIENPPAGGALSTGEDLKNLVNEARRKFVKETTKSKKEGGMGLSKGEAEKQAEKLIGVTWDVGHINMMRGQGFSEKEIIKESEKIAPFLKHVHLSDNFGMEHTELPMGMGNVPFKEIMEKLGEKGYEAKKIIEAGNWWQHFSQGGKANSPFKPSIMAVGSPIYSMMMTPYWNQSPGLAEGYMGDYGMMLPDTHYQMFGAGFSQLPLELGGQRQGAQGSRMSGRPME